MELFDLYCSNYSTVGRICQGLSAPPTNEDQRASNEHWYCDIQDTPNRRNTLHYTSNDASMVSAGLVSLSAAS